VSRLRFESITPSDVLWHVDALLDNGSYQTAAHKQQQRNGVFCAVRAEMLQSGQLAKVG
jgi:hypothetical protein